MELGFGIWFQFTSGNPLPLQSSDQIWRNIFLINIKIIPHCDHEVIGNSVRGHPNLLFLYQIRAVWWGLIELDSLLPFFSSVNIKYKFHFLQLSLNFIPSRITFLIVKVSDLAMSESKILIVFQTQHAKNYPGGGGGVVISLATEGLLLNRIYT